MTSLNSDSDSGSDSQVLRSPDTAYLFSWDGRTWRDVVRLKGGQTTTIGRSATNRIVLHDEACSRNHCEVFYSDGEWMLRDLGSRNGTRVNDERISGDVSLASRDLITIGSCRMAFTHSLDAAVEPPESRPDDVTEAGGSEESAHDASAILHRTGSPGFLKDESRPAEAAELARLYQLGLRMGAAKAREDLTEVVLTSLANETVADIAAVLLVNGPTEHPTPTDLQIVQYSSRNDLPYRRISDNLSRVVISSREAILARDVGDDLQLSVFDSLGEMRAASVICAPIHCDDRIRGVIHLYSTNPDNPLDRHDLEYTVAVARQLALALDHLQERDSLQSGLVKARNENRSLRRQLTTEVRMIGESAAMKRLRERLQLIAETDANVLIRGESGCGKELIARNIHASSRRSDAPFVCLNCAALNENLLESELFGHEKGAFTGAAERKIGRFEQADQGTLFLDEVGEMSPAIQAKFLRVLEGHPFERVGGRKSIQVDVRIVAATNRDLEEAVEDGEFRKDLYFRLHVAELFAEPLRRRTDDIRPLAEFFLQRFVEKTGRMITGFTDEAISVLEGYSWPGNVRELQNTIERTVILCRSEVVRASDVQLSALASRLSDPDVPRPNFEGFQETSLADIERQHILSTLDHTEWNKSRASQILGIERSTLDRKLKRYHVSRPD